jgi:hypothetical protein
MGQVISTGEKRDWLGKFTEQRPLEDLHAYGRKTLKHT